MAPLKADQPGAQGEWRYQVFVDRSFLGRAVRITELSVAPCSSGTFSADEFEVRMSSTSARSPSVDFDVNLPQVQTVRRAAPIQWTAVADRWTPLGLDIPFDHDGYQNLVIEIRYRGGALASGYGGRVRESFQYPRLVAFGPGSYQATTGTSSPSGMKFRLTLETLPVQDLGIGCGTPTPPFLRAFGAPDWPQLGNPTFGLEALNMNSGALAVLFVGDVGLPYPLGGGCSQYVGSGPGLGIYPLAQGNVDAQGYFRIPMPIPNDPLFDGYSLGFQVAELQPATGAFLGTVDLSNGLQVTLTSATVLERFMREPCQCEVLTDMTLTPVGPVTSVYDAIRDVVHEAAFLTYPPEPFQVLRLDAQSIPDPQVLQQAINEYSTYVASFVDLGDQLVRVTWQPHVGPSFTTLAVLDPNGMVKFEPLVDMSLIKRWGPPPSGIDANHSATVDEQWLNGLGVLKAYVALEITATGADGCQASFSAVFTSSATFPTWVEPETAAPTPQLSCWSKRGCICRDTPEREGMMECSQAVQAYTVKTGLPWLNVVIWADSGVLKCWVCANGEYGHGDPDPVQQ